MSAIVVTACAPLRGITITFKQADDLFAQEQEYVIKRHFSIPVRQGCITAFVGRSEQHTLNATENELTLTDLSPRDVIEVSTYVKQPPYTNASTLQPTAKKFRVTQEMDESVITLNCNLDCRII